MRHSRRVITIKHNEPQGDLSDKVSGALLRSRGLRNRRRLVSLEMAQSRLALGLLHSRKHHPRSLRHRSDLAGPSVWSRLRCLRWFLHCTLFLLGLGFRWSETWSLGLHRLRDCRSRCVPYHVHASESRCPCKPLCCSYAAAVTRSLMLCTIAPRWRTLLLRIAVVVTQISDNILDSDDEEDQ